MNKIKGDKYMAYKDGKVWKAVVYDKPSGRIVTMCELQNGEWKDCEFSTKEAAEAEEKRYREFWSEY